MNMDELDFPDDLLPEFTPELHAKIAKIHIQRDAERRLDLAANAKFQETFQARQKALAAGGTIHRSNSSASSYVRGPANYPAALEAHISHNTAQVPAHGATAPLSIPSKSGRIYANNSYNFSTHSLGPNVHFRAGPVTSTPSIVNQPTIVRRRNDSSASVKPSIYANPSHNLSTHSLGPNAMFGSVNRPRMVRQDSSQSAVVVPTSVCPRRRNESSASSKSSLRTGADVLRVARGPHAAKLQGAAQAKGIVRFDHGLQVNDSDGSGDDWGLGPCKSKKAATIAGQGRGGRR
jgi:hypothetical protein